MKTWWAGRALMLVPLWVCVAQLLIGCNDANVTIDSCASAQGLTPICGVQNPEDLAVLPGNRYVVSSQYGGTAGEKPAGLAVFDSQTGMVGKWGPFEQSSQELWGDKHCVTPPGAKFSAHGIEVTQRSDGRWQLIAVNHGGRESLEWFELIPPASTDDPYSISWRGCAVVPDHRSINAVASLPKDAGVLVSQIWQHEGPASPLFATWNLVMSRFGLGSGAILRWDGNTFSEVPETSGLFPNGIVVSPDGAFMYVNMEGYNQLWKIPVTGGKAIAKVDVGGMPDNVRWNMNRSKLLVASLRGSFRDMGNCMDLPSGACPMKAAIVEVDPTSMKAKDIFEHEGAPMGGYTVAVELPDSLLLGAYASDRYLRVPKQLIHHN